MGLLVLFGVLHARKTDDAREMLDHAATVSRRELVPA
jgi:uncharacterized protein (DUF1778 family)